MAKKNDSSKELLRELDIKKEDLIEDIKKDIKEYLYEEITNKVDYEAKNKLDKMEKRIYRTKNFAILKRNIIILIFLAIIIFETIVIYDNNLLFNLNKRTNSSIAQDKNSNEKKKDEKDSKWYIENYSYLLENIKTNLDDENKYYLYESNHKVEDISNKVKLNMSYQLLKNVDNDNGVIRISDEELKQSYKKIFGNINDYKQENFNNSCVQFIFNKQLKSYMAIDTECEKREEEILRIIKNIYEKDNNIVIEAYIGLYNKEENRIRTIENKKYYDYNKNNIEKLNIYNFVFKKIDNEYYLYEIINK